MIRITKLTDYGIVLLSHMAQDETTVSQNVKDLAAATHLPEPTVGKLLKSLAKSGILISQRGAHGGYSLSRSASEITVAQIIGAIDGPIAITDCSNELSTSKCELERLCPVRSNWQKINVSIKDALEGVSLADMVKPQTSNFIRMSNIKRTSVEGFEYVSN